MEGVYIYEQSGTRRSVHELALRKQREADFTPATTSQRRSLERLPRVSAVATT